MGKRYQEAVFEKSKTKGPQRLLLTILAFHANDETGLCFPNHETLKDEANMGESTVKRILTQLKELGEVLVSNKRGRGRGNRYIITLGLSEAEVWAMVDDYKKKSITFETLYWEKRLKSVSEPGHYNEESVSVLEEKSIESETLNPKSVSVLNEKSLRTETSMLTKRTESKRELKGELKDPPATSTKPNSQANGELKPEYQKVEDLRIAICELCKIHLDKELATPKQVDLVEAALDRLLKQDVTAKDVKAFKSYWYSQDWRGQKGGPPTPLQICELWERFRGAKLNGSRLASLTPDQLAAYKAREAEAKR